MRHSKGRCFQLLGVVSSQISGCYLKISQLSLPQLTATTRNSVSTDSSPLFLSTAASISTKFSAAADSYPDSTSIRASSPEARSNKRKRSNPAEDKGRTGRLKRNRIAATKSRAKAYATERQLESAAKELQKKCGTSNRKAKAPRRDT